MDDVQDLAVPATAADRADLGWHLLGEVLDTGDTSSLPAALDLLGDALAADPRHGDAPWWHYGLGVARACAAERSGAVPDWDGAIEELRHSWDVHHPFVDRAELADDIATVLTQRADAQPELDELAVDALVDDLDALAEPGRAPGPALQLARGFARLERSRKREGSADRQTGLALLREALPDAPDDTPLLSLALFQFALFAGNDGDDKTESLAAIERLRLMGPDEQDPELDQLESDLLYLTWSRTEDPAQEDAALDRLERLCSRASEPPVDALVSCGQFRLIRVARTAVGDGIDADLDAAVRWLEAASAATVVVDEDAAITQLLLGRARLLRQQRRGGDADAPRAITCFDEALQIGLPSTEQTLDAHEGRLSALAAGPLDEDDPGPDVVHAADHALRAARAALTAHPDADPGARAELAMELVHVEQSLFAVHRHEIDVDRMREELELAGRHPTPPTEWSTMLSVFRSCLEGYSDTYGTSRGDMGVAAIVEAIGGSRHLDLMEGGLHQMLGMMSLFSSSRNGTMHALHTAAAVLGGPDATATDRFLAAYAGIPLCLQQGRDTEQMLSTVDRALAAAAEIRPDSVVERMLAEALLPMLHAIREMIRPTGGRVARRTPATGSGAIGMKIDRFMDFMEGVARAASADPLQQVHELEALERATPEADSDALVSGVAAGALLTLWLDRAEKTGDPADAERAIAWIPEALAGFNGPDHPLWVQTTRQAAQAHRLRGRPEDLARSRELGLAMLRGHAWMVLLQSGTDHAITMARAAAADAVRVARWCLADRAADDMIAALDAGRGLVLQAAVATRGVGDQLRAAGEAALFDEWAEAGGDDRIVLEAAADLDLHSDLRRRVLLAVGSGDGPAPVSTTSIQATLAEQGAAALVYLVPADDDGPGLAVVVPAREPVEVLELPDLDAAAAAVLAHGVAPGWAPRDIELLTPPTGSHRLADLLAFAWRTAGHELAELADRLTGPTGRLPALVLVPFGALALVPWHAARPARSDEPGLLARAVVSSVPSARLLERALARPRHPGGAAVIVGNPTGDLRDAGAEARSVVRAFHPDATYLGTLGAAEPGDPLPTGRGDAAEVLARVAAGAAPLSVLHLACHARADPAAPARSSLVLADRPVDVEEVLALRRAEPLDVDTVFLAGCSTNVPGADHDEAFSLAAAFLAAGARTAFGSMWPVPDGHTSRLMFMVHHHLGAGDCSPAEALHRAQRWAADPARIPPPTMPPALARDASGGEDPIAWAGFQHLGA